jgi:MFS family permease
LAANRQLFILLSLYVAQGLPIGFFTQAMPAIMRNEGIELKYIGLMSLLALPWALKILWAPLLDRYTVGLFPLRKGWILLANALAVLTVISLSLYPLEFWIGTGMVVTMLLLFSLNIFAASQDISTDALAVESVPADQRGWINGIQVSGYRIGMVIGGGAILAWLPVLGWQYSMILMALILLLTSLPILFTTQAQGAPAYIESSSSHDESILHVSPASDGVVSSWKGLFNRNGIWLWIGLLLIYKSGDAFGTAMLKPLMIDKGYQLADVAVIIGSYGVVAGLVGAILGAALVKPLGRINALLIFALLQTMSLCLYGLYAMGWIPDNGFIMLCIIEHVTGAMATIGVFTVMMDYCREHHAGLDYSFQSCLVVISGLIMGALSGFSVEAIGYGWHFIVAAGLTVLGFAWVLWQRKSILLITSS